MSSYLGYLIGRGIEDAKYYIVSNDKGYDCLCDYWKEQGVAVNRIGAAEPANKAGNSKKNTPSNPSPKKKTKKKASDPVTIEEIKRYLSKEDSPEKVLAIFNQFNTKHEICDGMSRKFKDSKKAGAVYRKIKPLLKEKNKK